MSGRRVPLSTNQNVANSPLRSSALLAKHKRSATQLQREDQYGQPPPAKKQIIEGRSQRPLKSPSQQQHRASRSQIPIQTRRNANSYENKLAKERSGHHHHQHQHQQAVSTNPGYTEKDVEEIQVWQQHHRARFPKLVFYFEKVPNDAHKKLAKQIAALGAREAAFFSIDITHVVTTRTIPSEKSVSRREEEHAASEKHTEQIQDQEQDQEEVKTINPSLLTRLSEASTKRRFDGDLRTRKMPSHTQIEPPKRNMDVLLRAREMGKKIWSLDKLQRMLDLLLETDPYVSAEIAYGARKTRVTETRTTEDRNLLNLLHNERVNGPSDRDPTANAQDLQFFKGPYIYIYDFEEKQKPIMVREYKKVAEKSKGEWPQFRTAALGRCPFIDEYEPRDTRPQPKPKVQVTRATAETKPVLQPPTKMDPPKPVTGKRSLGEMQKGHCRGSSIASIEMSIPTKPTVGPFADTRPQAFTGRSASRLFGGEPVASGVQPSNVTSAIRSQMVSSTATTPGVITGLSKEVHGLQRQVLKRNSTATSQDFSSRRNGEASFRDEVPAKRSFSTMSRTSSRKLDMIEEAAAGKNTQAVSKAVPRTTKRETAQPKKAELKPGYCENCSEKYADFDEHILTKKHRKFADDNDNWGDLDDLLSQLQRAPKHKSFASWTPTLADFEEAY
ncbi:Dfp1/Him1, central region-domain-containing protein [Annulohypoxylon maeteangense]|uniref:Dfp1/Him1, central region-domain-containing protein n=1 Tax=Annulohypoxylon maeteangense TaxID=1927788 RepID=UPI0020087063|nr:Dfp1/Him1, central region-domain-containing protein [Annulohypoxylon maeteangense]KAI0888327.1 Dfp1/Him1, central region-domain-containing protein [Annulohypoxylon maeteangense]